MPIGQIRREPAGRNGRPVHILVVEALIAHPLRERPRVRGQTGNAHRDVIVNFEDFLLVRGQLGDGALECADDGVGGGAQADACRSLFDGFHGVFYLKKTAFGRPDCDVGVILIAEHIGLVVLEGFTNILKDSMF